MRLLTSLLLTAPVLAQDGHGHGPSHEEHDPSGAPIFISAAIDGWLEAVDDADDDGFDMRLRALEVTTHAQVDALTLAYVALVADEQDVSIEEAAVLRQLQKDTGLRVGRFFADFGRHMQMHQHELPFPQRPRVLKAFLGDELVGTGYGRNTTGGWVVTCGMRPWGCLPT